jgi:uncharacterized protein with PIN domain
MFLDASAMIGIIAMEEDGTSLAGRLARAAHIHTSALAIFEAVIGLHASPTRRLPMRRPWSNGS